MERRPSAHAPAHLTVHLEGKAVARHRIALQDLILFGHQLQAALIRVGTVLSGGMSLKRRRKPLEIAEACALDLVNMSQGSLALGFEPRRLSHEQLKIFPEANTLAEQTLEHFVEGIATLSEEAHEDESDQAEDFPRGYDRSVLLALREGAKILEHGISAIGFDLQSGGQHRKASYTAEVHRIVVERIRAPIVSQRAIEGRLLMGDFRQSDLRCRIHPSVGAPIMCTFDEAQRDTILAALTRHVRIVGDSKEEAGRIVSLNIADLEILDRDQVKEEAQALFEEKADLDQLAAEQGVSPAANFNALLGDFWPEDETADEFIAQVRAWRREDASKRSL